MSLFSIQIEKHALGGLIQNPEVLSDVEGFLSEKDFYVEPHNVIFCCLKSLILSNEKPDKVLLGQKIKNLGISFKENINIFDYIEAISFAPITPKATFQACQELAKLKALRALESTSQAIKHHINKSIDQPLEKTITEVDAIYGGVVNSFNIQEIPQDLFESMYETIEERGNNPVEEVGISTPFAEFNRLYGGLRGKNIYAIASRSGEVKSTWLNDISSETGRIHGIPVLQLDTEMSSEEIMFRTAAAKSGVPLWYLETGNWRKNASFVDKVRNTLKNLKKDYKVYHYYVGNRPVDEVCSIIRRWYLSVVGRGNKCIVCYDYLKLTGEKLSNNWAEYQALGEKVDKFKSLCKELDFPFLTAIQINRSGENRGRQSDNVTDDASVISISDRLLWFTTYLGIFRRKTEDELMLDTPGMGTHKLVEIKARYQGREAAGHQDWIQRTFPDGSQKYVRNYINYSIENFRVVENGSLRDSIAAQNAQFLLTSPERGERETL
jgi:replicative DNA helicase